MKLMLSMRKHPAPAMMYSISPANANVLVLNKEQSFENVRFVRMMKRAGRLIISCTSISGSVEKWSLISPRAGKMAAPAITVRSEIERTVKVSLPSVFLFII